MSDSCIFCKILARQIPSSIIAENDYVFVLKDIAPKAPIHYLIIPKKHISDIASLTQDDKLIAASILYMAQHLSKTVDGAQSFKLINNNGTSVGQSVFHIHFHFLAGSRLTAFSV